jgi:hypothetical protein
LIFRAVRNPASTVSPHSTPRPPGNLPFYVDNIWESLRPAGFPSRRYSAFASPDPEQAAASAGLRPDQVYRVRLPRDTSACQIVRNAQPEDARYHSDVKMLRSMVIPEWFKVSDENRRSVMALFAPCTSREDVEAALSYFPADVVDGIKTACSFWHDVQIFDPETPPPSSTGEIFFEGTYHLDI